VSVVLSSAAIYSYAIVAIFGLLILRRAWAMTHGAPVSVGRLVLLPGLYVVIYVAELAAIGYGAIGTSFTDQIYAGFGADAVLLFLGVLVAYRYTVAHVHIYQDPGSSVWKYRLNALLPVVYVVLFFARTAIETVVLSLSPFEFPTAATFVGISPLSLYLLFAVDALWGLSTGFLVGRSAAVYHLWKQKAGAPGPAPDAALP
jgi:hypothetical protein